MAEEEDVSLLAVVDEVVLQTPCPLIAVGVMMIGVLNFFQTVDEEEATYLDVDEEEDEATVLPLPARVEVVEVVE
jgi:hypothetical protein